MANWTQNDIDALKAAMATGASRVKYGDKEVFYRSVNDMERQLVRMEQEVNGRPRRSRTFGIYIKTGC